jgi:FkbM family methyltransferase
MSISPIRKILRKTTGFDLHRYRPDRDKFSWLESMNIQTVIDIGANIGQTAKEMRIRFPEAQIYSFEPQKDAFDEMNEAMKGDAKFKAFNIGIGEKKESVTMHKNPYSQSSSILDMADLHRETFPESRGSEENITIQIERLDDVLKVSDLKRDILFKIDVQGYEDKAIRGSEQVLRASKIVLIENSFLSLYKGQPLFADTYKMLTGLGFTYRGALWQKLDPKTGAVMFEDSLFLRE